MNPDLSESDPSLFTCSTKISNWIKFLKYSHILVIKFEAVDRKNLEGLKKKSKDEKCRRRDSQTRPWIYEKSQRFRLLVFNLLAQSGIHFLDAVHIKPVVLFLF